MPIPLKMVSPQKTRAFSIATQLQRQMQASTPRPIIGSHMLYFVIAFNLASI